MSRLHQRITRPHFFNEFSLLYDWVSINQRKLLNRSGRSCCSYKNPMKMKISRALFAPRKTPLGEVWEKIFILRFWGRTSRIVPFLVIT
ncbi:hypothetical protein Y032_0137g2013 [Ancylostoma ceylanicum]|uniref:Uncharacterized protein n=1 Tax=Ancylostoma ceylanicum TaxID=53326 RepID=A0A016T470_9BILA|nr:hypothetical protein Y032_0137g2013 [Ancylostoma ceylanicum]